MNWDHALEPGVLVELHVQRKPGLFPHQAWVSGICGPWSIETAMHQFEGLGASTLLENFQKICVDKTAVLLVSKPITIIGAKQRGTLEYDIRAFGYIADVYVLLDHPMSIDSLRRRAMTPHDRFLEITMKRLA